MRFGGDAPQTSSASNVARFSLPSANPGLSNSELAQLRFGGDTALPSSTSTLDRLSLQSVSSGLTDSRGLTNSQLAQLRFGDDSFTSSESLRQGRQGLNSNRQGGFNSGGQGGFTTQNPLGSNSNNPLAQTALGLGQNNLQSVTSIDNKFTRTAIGGSIVPNIQAIQTDPAFRNLKVTSSGLAGLADSQLSRHFLGLNPTIMESLQSGRGQSHLAQLQAQQQPGIANSNIFSEESLNFLRQNFKRQNDITKENTKQQPGKANSDIFSDESLNFLRQNFKRQNDIGGSFLDDEVLSVPFSDGTDDFGDIDYDYEEEEELAIDQSDALAEIIKRLEMLEQETGVPINEILNPFNDSIPILPPPGSVPFLFPEDPPRGHPNSNVHRLHPPNHLLVTPFPRLIPAPDPNHVETHNIPRQEPKQHFGGVIHDPEVPPPFIPHPQPPLPHHAALPDLLHDLDLLHMDTHAVDPHHGPKPLVHHHPAHHPGKIPKPVEVKVRLIN